ncbi:MAG: M20/M25/M40 family metallo-hydrolase [Eubacteriales bacterium]
MYQTLKELCRISAVSGNERALGEKIRTLIAPHVTQCHFDTLGNLIAYRKGRAAQPERVIFAAHMDEVGFLVNFIEESGFLRFAPLGGASLTAALYSPVVFAGGCRGLLLPETESLSKPSIEHCYVDIGAKNAKEAAKRVRVGETFSLAPSLSALTGSRWAGRPLDDRVGCAVLIEAARQMAEPENDVYFVFSVQEEVGCRGARTAAYAIRPDYGFAVDVTTAADQPADKVSVTKLGDGAAIKVKDNSVICDSRLVARMGELARARGIRCQYEVLTAGGTDASVIQLAGSGAVVGGISIPTRNIHSAVEAVDKGDVLAAAKLVAALAECPTGQLVEGGEGRA